RRPQRPRVERRRHRHLERPGGLLDVPAQFAVGAGPAGSAVADMNHDGFNDVVVADSGGSSVSVLLGDGGGVFSIPSLDAPAGLAPTAVAIADFNLDGNLDVAAGKPK